MYNAEHNQVQSQSEEPVAYRPESAELTQPSPDVLRDDPLTQTSRHILSADAAGAEAIDDTANTGDKELEVAKSTLQ